MRIDARRSLAACVQVEWWVVAFGSVEDQVVMEVPVVKAR